MSMISGTKSNTMHVWMARKAEVNLRRRRVCVRLPELVLLDFIEGPGNFLALSFRFSVEFEGWNKRILVSGCL